MLSTAALAGPWKQPNNRSIRPWLYLQKQVGTCPRHPSKAKPLPALPWPPPSSWIQQLEGPFLGLPCPQKTQPHGSGHHSDLTRPPHRTPAAPGHGPAARSSSSCLPECNLSGGSPCPMYNIHRPPHQHHLSSQPLQLSPNTFPQWPVCCSSPVSGSWAPCSILAPGRCLVSDKCLTDK